ARNIAAILDRVLALEPLVDALVVDDCSPDGTAAIALEYVERYPERVHLIQRTAKLGLGTAYLAGFTKARELGYSIICEMDADLSHNPKDLPKIIAPVAQGEADLAIGSRYKGGVRIMNWPLRRLLLSYSAGVYTRLITRLPVHDVTAGFKCFHSRVFDEIDFSKVKSNGYSFQIEMNYRAWKKGFRIVEIPIVFTERTEGQSKMSKSIVREAAFKVWELRLRQLLGRL
ncbi:MAG: polyprenol monophosphomannose synthase, partial [Rhodothermales bacterium]|nr:polyprenol monophosphomannose synthase [Rhodothermales bacterium]